MKISIPLFLLAVMTVIWPHSANAAENSYPKLANYFLEWEVPSTQAADLAKWDLLIMSTQAAERNPEILHLIKKINPDIKILAYFVSQEIAVNSKQINPSGAWGDIYSQVDGHDWWLKDIHQNKLNWWPGTHMIDVNNSAWQAWLPKYIKTNHLDKQPLWDGVYYDNCWRDVSWLGYELDFNNDGQADNASTMDKTWINGITSILKNSRRLFRPGTIVMCNGGTPYQANYHGRMYETFPLEYEGGWASNMNDYTSTGAYSVINVNNLNQQKPWNLQAMRFGLTSSLLGNGYFSFDYGDQNHGQTWWLEEYDANLGQPINKPYLINNGLKSFPIDFSEGLWRRDFTNGSVIVNSSSENKIISFNDSYKTVSQGQILVKNNDNEFSLNLAAHDGAILLKSDSNQNFSQSFVPAAANLTSNKPSPVSDPAYNRQTGPVQTQKNWSFTNGSSLNLYNDQAQALETNYLMYDSFFPLGTKLIKTDINQDGLMEIISYDKSLIKIYTHNYKLKNQFYPFGPYFNQGFNIVVEDLDNDGYQEIITAPQKGLAHVKTFSASGHWLNPGFFPYGQAKIGAELTVADLDYDGQKEIIVAPSQANREIKFFSRLGQEMSEKKFMAFENLYQGGLEIDAADINKDGYLELVVSRKTGADDLKIFSLINNRLLSHWLVSQNNAQQSTIKAANFSLGYPSSIIYLNESNLRSK